MNKEDFFKLAIDYLSEDRNISIWETWCAYRDRGEKDYVNEEINIFLHNRAFMIGCSFFEDIYSEMTDKMWSVLTYNN